MQKNLRETAKEVLSKENNKGVNVKEFRKCKLSSVDTRYGVTNKTPILSLVYEFEDTGEIEEDIFCFTDNSIETVIQRLNKAYIGFTNERLSEDDFESPSILKSKFDGIIGKESLVKEYKNAQGFTNYQHFVPNEDNQENENYNFWCEEESVIEENLSKTDTSSSTNVDLSPTPSTNTNAVNLQEELEAE